MKIRIASDLHLEAFRGRDMEALVVDVLHTDEQDADSVLVLAGDISSDPNQLITFIKAIEPRFAKVIYIPGNHEYYRHNYDAWNSEMNDRFAVTLTNTVWANDDVGVYTDGNVRVIFGTLWADGGTSLAEQARVGYGLNDFRVISIGAKMNENRQFTVTDMIKIHKKQKATITTLLNASFDGTTVVATHHMPTYRLCHPRFGSDINGGFAANCEDILAYDHAPAVWIYGHTHDSGDGVMWKTRLVANPRGYPQEFSSDSEFNSYKLSPKFIEV